MSDLSCEDIIASWIESDPFELIRKTSYFRDGPESDVGCTTTRKGSTFEKRLTNLIQDDQESDPGDNRSGSSSDATSHFHSVSADVSVVRICLDEPERTLQFEFPAPPPKLHYSTRWRKITRKKLQEHIGNESLIIWFVLTNIIDSWILESYFAPMSKWH